MQASLSSKLLQGWVLWCHSWPMTFCYLNKAPKRCLLPFLPFYFFSVYMMPTVLFFQISPPFIWPRKGRGGRGKRSFILMSKCHFDVFPWLQAIGRGLPCCPQQPAASFMKGKQTWHACILLFGRRDMQHLAMSFHLAGYGNRIEQEVCVQWKHMDPQIQESDTG